MIDLQPGAHLYVSNAMQYGWVFVGIVVVFASLAIVYVLAVMIDDLRRRSRRARWVGMCKLCAWEIVGSDMDAVGRAVDRHVIATHQVNVTPIEQVKNAH